MSERYWRKEVTSVLWAKVEELLCTSLPQVFRYFEIKKNTTPIIKFLWTTPIAYCSWQRSNCHKAGELVHCRTVTWKECWQFWLEYDQAGAQETEYINSIIYVLQRKAACCFFYLYGFIDKKANICRSDAGYTFLLISETFIQALLNSVASWYRLIPSCAHISDYRSVTVTKRGVRCNGDDNFLIILASL